jgi:hypothetical protein
MNIYIDLIIAALATEAMTNLLTKSEFSIRFIKEPLFKSRFRALKFVHDILDCGYCTSVWAAIVPTLWFFTDHFDFVITILVLHRLANVLHFTIDWLDKKRPRDLDYTSKGEDYERLRKEHDTPVVSHDEEDSGAGSKTSLR